jgi:hypothetical protein
MMNRVVGAMFASAMLLCSAVVAALAFGAIGVAPVAAQQTLGYVYTLGYTGPGTNILFGAALDTNGTLTNLAGFPFPTGGTVGSRLIYDAANKRLYALNSGSQTVNAWSVNTATGALTAMPFSPFALPIGGGFTFWPSMCANPSGSVLVFDRRGVYPGFENVVSFLITATTATQVSFLGTDPIHPASCTFSQDGAFLYTGYLDSIVNFRGYSVNQSTGVLTELPGSPFSTGSSGAYFYRTDSSGRLFAVNTNSDGLVFTTAAGIPTPVPGNPFPNTQSVSSMLLHPSGYYLTTSSGGNNIAVFRINGSGSATTLSPVAGSPFANGGLGSVVSVVDGTGNFLVTANNTSRNTTVFGFDQVTGALTQLLVTPPNSFGTTVTIRDLAFAPVSTATPPTVVTGAATSVSQTSATLTGTANPNGASTTANFEYGLTIGYGSTTPPQSIGSATGAVAIGGGGVAGLACGSLYHFRATATNAGGTSVGSDATFTTAACPPPTVVTGIATGISRTGATLNGTANPNGAATTAYFEYGRTVSYGTTTPVQTLGAGNSGVAIGGGSITGLICNTLYHFRAVATNTSGTTNGADATLTTVRCAITSDFDGDGKADPTVYRPSTGGWFALQSSTNYSSSLAFSWGLSTDTPVPGDYDGDGKIDPAIFRPSTGLWAILKSSTNYTTSTAVSWGLSTDVPVPGDFDGDGKADPTVFRPSTGGWFILKSSTNYTTSFGVSWGLSTDTPLPADYDGDGKADPAIYRPSTGLWAILNSSTNYTTSSAVSWGLSTDVAVPGDYDGDGKADPAVFRPSTGGWFVLKSSTNYTSSFGVSWGLSTDVPAPADYDGDGKFDPAIFRPSTGLWAILQSSTNYTSSIGVSWGLSTDVPINKRP